MTPTNEALPEPVARTFPTGIFHHRGAVTKTGTPLYTAQQLTDYAARQCAARDVEIERLHLDNLHMTQAMMQAYGHLWHVNNEPMAPVPLYSPEKAAYEARKILRDILTGEQRGIAINQVQLLRLPDYLHEDLQAVVEILEREILK